MCARNAEDISESVRNAGSKMIADKGSFKEWFTGIDNSNPLDYPDYPQKIEDTEEKNTP